MRDHRNALRAVVNRNFVFGDFNKYLDNTYNANVFCPFHEHSFQGKGNAKLYFDEDREIWVLHCFAGCGTLTTFDYVERILVERKKFYPSVQDFLRIKLGETEFLTQYKLALENEELILETERQERSRYITNTYNEVDDVVEFIENLYMEKVVDDEDSKS